MKKTLVFLCILISAMLTAQEKGDRYGICLIDRGKITGCNAEELFAMHSVMKFPQALYVAGHLQSNGLTLNDSVLVVKDRLDQDTWSPMLEKFQTEKYFTYAELLEYSLARSDNNACDLLFEHCGSPSVVEAYIHSLGFTDIHIRLTEKEMHLNPDRAVENCCTPVEMARLFEWFRLRRHDNEFFEFFSQVMGNCRTGLERISAALPSGSLFIHKTGSGFTDSEGKEDRNDAGIILFPDGSQATIAVFAAAAKSESDVADIAAEYLWREK